MIENTNHYLLTTKIITYIIMGLFNFSKNKKTKYTTHSSGSYFETDIDDANLSKLINQSIFVFQDNPNFDSNQIIDMIKKYRNDENLALALYRFIPIAYCRLIIPNKIFSILSHSADFKAINDALNHGSELKNLICSPTCILCNDF